MEMEGQVVDCYIEQNSIADINDKGVPELDITIAEQMADSVLSCDIETTDPEPKMEKITKFSSGLSFIEAFKTGNSEKSPIKTTPVFDQKWQIWYWKRNGDKHGKKWEDFLQMKSSFTTREEFWRAYNELNGYEFGLLSTHFDYCVFREGIKPMWEDSANRRGGRWILEFPRKKDWKHMSYLDEMWLKVLLAITGGIDYFKEYMEELSGVVLMIRYGVNKIAVWTKNSDNTLINLKIGQLLKSSTGFIGKMYYLSHDSTVKKIVVKKEPKIRSNQPF